MPPKLDFSAKSDYFNNIQKATKKRIFMIFKAAIFDLDGTLLDSMKIWSNLCSEFLLRHNINEDIDLDGKLLNFTKSPKNLIEL